MPKGNIFYLIKLFYLIMIFYITNIPITQEEKNKQPNRKMGKVRGDLQKRKHKWPINVTKGTQPVKIIL